MSAHNLLMWVGYWAQQREQGTDPTITHTRKDAITRPSLMTNANSGSLRPGFLQLRTGARRPPPRACFILPLEVRRSVLRL